MYVDSLNQYVSWCTFICFYVSFFFLLFFLAFDVQNSVYFSPVYGVVFLKYLHSDTYYFVLQTDVRFRDVMFANFLCFL